MPVFSAWLVLTVSYVMGGSSCPFRQQFWSNDLQKCINCSSCSGGLVVLRPCDIDRDALCGPLSSLGLDWPMFPGKGSKKSAGNASEDSLETSDEMVHGGAMQKNGSEKVPEEPFSSMEILVLDWQIAALMGGLIGLFLLFCIVGVLLVQHLARCFCGCRGSAQATWARMLVCDSESQQGLYMDTLLERKQDEDPRYH